ncbi:uncharacterized protein LOC143218328 [Lasioglossum baleicum]|uniref:uncharacterized protein LOC143218328 n=1 Tax=Lasioglossum baleicum TaxID=434251 RepID=UPI003FCCCA29
MKISPLPETALREHLADVDKEVFACACVCACVFSYEAMSQFTPIRPTVRRLSRCIVLCLVSMDYGFPIMADLRFHRQQSKTLTVKVIAKTQEFGPFRFVIPITGVSARGRSPRPIPKSSLDSTQLQFNTYAARYQLQHSFTSIPTQLDTNSNTASLQHLRSSTPTPTQLHFTSTSRFYAASLQHLRSSIPTPTQLHFNTYAARHQLQHSFTSPQQVDSTQLHFNTYAARHQLQHSFTSTPTQLDTNSNTASTSSKRTNNCLSYW